MRRHIEIRDKVDFRVQGRVFAKFAKDSPKIGTCLNEWAEATAVEFNVTTDAILECVAVYIEQQRLILDEDRYTESQRIAHLLGHNKGKVISRLAEMLFATKTELIYRTVSKSVRDPDGNQVSTMEKYVELDDKGDFLVHEQPDWRAVGEASKQLNQVHGSFAPDQLVVDMNQRVDITHTISDAELQSRIKQKWESLPTVARQFFPAAVAGIEPPAGRAEGAAGSDGSTILDVELHKDSGRAGA